MSPCTHNALGLMHGGSLLSGVRQAVQLWGSCSSCDSLQFPRGSLISAVHDSVLLLRSGQLAPMTTSSTFRTPSPNEGI